MQRSACTSCGMSTAALTSEAESSTAPAAVIHEWSGWGERKKASAASEVCVSSRSANHISHDTHRSLSLSNRFSLLYRSINSTAEGGEPARTSSRVTALSRRENAEYMVGRYEINSATRNRPML